MALTSNLEELEESEERIFCYLGNKLKENIEINEKWCECVMLIVVFLNPSCLFRSKHIMMMGTEILSFRFSPAFLVQQQFLANVLYNLALMVTQICSVLQIKYSMVSICRYYILFWDCFSKVQKVFSFMFQYCLGLATSTPLADRPLQKPGHLAVSD